MTGARTWLICAALTVALSACSTSEDREVPVHQNQEGLAPNCAKTTSNGDDETDGGVGGTGKSADECNDDQISE